MASDSDIVPVEVPVVHIDSVATTGCSLLEAARIVTEIADFDIEYCVLVVREKPAVAAHTEAAGDIAIVVVAAAVVGVAADDEMALQAKQAKVLRLAVPMAALAVEVLANAAVHGHSDSSGYIDALAAAGDIAIAVDGDTFAAAAALAGVIA